MPTPDTRPEGLPQICRLVRRRSGHRFSYRDISDVGNELSAVDRLLLLYFPPISDPGRRDKTGAETTEFPIYIGC
jgi:hypothetical protein